jgi:hypothetical protein
MFGHGRHHVSLGWLPHSCLLDLTERPIVFPLNRWKFADQVMIEKGKGIFIENLRIIQLVQADLNFILHVIWGNRLT